MLELVKTVIAQIVAEGLFGLLRLMSKSVSINERAILRPFILVGYACGRSTGVSVETVSPKLRRDRVADRDGPKDRVKRMAGNIYAIPAGLFVVINFPAQVFAQGFLYPQPDACRVDGGVMFKTAFANITQQFLEIRNSDHAVTAKSFERVAG